MVDVKVVRVNSKRVGRMGSFRTWKWKARIRNWFLVTVFEEIGEKQLKLLSMVLEDRSIFLDLFRS